MATTATADSVITVWLPDTGPWPCQLWGSVIDANQEATTVSVHCGSDHRQLFSNLDSHLTVTYGPSTVGYVYTEYSLHDGTVDTNQPAYETLACDLHSSSAICRDTFTPARSGTVWSETATRTWADLNAATYNHDTVTITATATSGKAEATSRGQTSSGSLSASVVTTNDASLTETGSTTALESTSSPTATGSSANALSAQQYPIAVGIAVVVGAIIVLM
ncbi:hypothetical protein BGZ63DRAFT_426954 [Mariannaea sp. PMI_226]|nr:hypothetical protein BGZ63DRAFT_426954 [Mariannaea sp. PMI_226]